MTRRVATFDVFDTVLTRPVADPIDAFHLLATRLVAEGLLAEGAAAAFALDRVAAERTARMSGNEPTLSQVYDRLAPRWGWNAGQRERALAIECQLETDLAHPVAAGVSAVDRARRAGATVAFVSDMYLDEVTVAEMLDRWGVRCDDERVYVSASQACSKETGALWRIVLDDLQVSPKALAHLGDNARGDVKVPRRLGIEAHHFGGAALSKRERLLADTGASPLASLLAGAARVARVARRPTGPHEATLVGAAASVAAPVLVGYVAHVLSHARRRSLRRLYFVSRDGYLPMRVAELLAPTLAPGVELRYLHGSRIAWHQALVDGDLSWVVDGSRPLEPGLVAGRLGLTVQELQDALGPVGNLRQRDEWLAALTHGGVTDRARDAASSRRALVLDYLRQEGLCDDGDWALVDVGWMGRQFDALGRLLRHAGASPGGCFLVGLRNPRTRAADEGWVDAYLYDARELPDVAHVRHAAAPLLELFCSAPDAGVIGYERTAGGVRPLLAGISNQPVVEWGLDSVHQTVLHAASVAADHIGLVDLDARVDAALAAVLLDLWHHPTTDEARALGSFPYQDDMEDGTHLPLARRYEWADVTGRGSPRSAADWAAASAVLTPQPLRTVVRLRSRLAAFRRLRHDVAP